METINSIIGSAQRRAGLAVALRGLDPRGGIEALGARALGSSAPTGGVVTRLRGHAMSFPLPFPFHPSGSLRPSAVHVS